MADRLIRFMLGADVRGEWVELDDSWREIVGRHALPEVAVHALGELAAASLLLSATLKHKGSLTAQIMGDEPMRLAVVECQAGGSFRATARVAENATLPEQADASALFNRNGKARFVITIDPREAGASAYQGIVPLEGRSISRVLERYMFRSEQLPTRLWVAANGERAAGLLLQKMPLDERQQQAGHDADAWPRLQKLADTLGRDEILSIDGDTAIHRLFWQEQVSAADTRDMRFACHCSRERVADMLRMLGREEVDSIIAEQGNIDVNCEYCNAPYRFDPVDSAELFAGNVAPAPDRSQ